MEHFTQNELRPSDYTLNIIRQVAYDYCAMKRRGSNEKYYLN